MLMFATMRVNKKTIEVVLKIAQPKNFDDVNMVLSSMIKGTAKCDCKINLGERAMNVSKGDIMIVIDPNKPMVGIVDVNQTFIEQQENPKEPVEMVTTSWKLN